MTRADRIRDDLANTRQALSVALHEVKRRDSELSELLTWLSQHHPAAITGMPTDLYRRVGYHRNGYAVCPVPERDA